MRSRFFNTTETEFQRPRLAFHTLPSPSLKLHVASLHSWQLWDPYTVCFFWTEVHCSLPMAILILNCFPNIYTSLWYSSDIPSSRELSLILTLGQWGTSSGISLYIESTQFFHLPYYINFICPCSSLRILWALCNVGLESINICQMNKWDNDSIFFIAPSAWKD